jgi:hypothetical protein
MTSVQPLTVGSDIAKPMAAFGAENVTLWLTRERSPD